MEDTENPLEALARELSEELGIMVDPADCAAGTFAQQSPAEAVRPIVILLYTCARWQGEPRPLEGGSLAWLGESEIQRLDRPPLDVMLCERLFARQVERTSGKRD